jgi:hypothetical protein
MKKCEGGDYKIIMDYLRDIDDWVLAGKVHGIDTPYGWIGFRGDRNCRDLIEAGKLEKKPNEKLCWVRVKRDRVNFNGVPIYAQKQEKVENKLF